MFPTNHAPLWSYGLAIAYHRYWLNAHNTKQTQKASFARDHFHPHEQVRCCNRGHDREHCDRLFVCIRPGNNWVLPTMPFQLAHRFILCWMWWIESRSCRSPWRIPSGLPLQSVAVYLQPRGDCQRYTILSLRAIPPLDWAVVQRSLELCAQVFHWTGADLQRP